MSDTQIVTATFKTLYSELEIQNRVSSLAQKIKSDYRNTQDNLILVCVLRGAVFFFSDLCKTLRFRDAQVEFLRATSYGNLKRNSRKVDIKFDFDVRGRDILLVDEIVDTGLTISEITKRLTGSGAKSVKVATLIDKRWQRKFDVQIDYPGFVLNSGFVTGYGMDCGGRYRMIPEILAHPNPRVNMMVLYNKRTQ